MEEVTLILSLLQNVSYASHQKDLPYFLLSLANRKVAIIQPRFHPQIA
jgi:hypothetical protein